MRGGESEGGEREGGKEGGEREGEEGESEGREERGRDGWGGKEGGQGGRRGWEEQIITQTVNQSHIMSYSCGLPCDVYNSSRSMPSTRIIEQRKLIGRREDGHSLSMLCRVQSPDPPQVVQYGF